MYAEVSWGIGEKRQLVGLPPRRLRFLAEGDADGEGGAFAEG
jgi:hypothetical protein